MKNYNDGNPDNPIKRPANHVSSMNAGLSSYKAFGEIDEIPIKHYFSSIR